MKLNTNLPAFNGYYGSIFEDTDNSSELEYINEQRAENNLLPLDNDNDIVWNYAEYYADLNKSLTNCVEDFLKDLGIVKSIDFVKLHSPKFYNFTNDVIECKANINVKNVKKYINENGNAFRLYLIDRFKSRDGFISFYEYDLNFWLNKMKTFKDLDHIEVHAILDFICENENFDIVDHLYNGAMYNVPNLYASNIENLITE